MSLCLKHCLYVKVTEISGRKFEFYLRRSDLEEICD